MEGPACWSLRLLGGFELSAPGGDNVAVPGKQGRVLLAFLALSPNCRQPRQKLVKLLWGEASDETVLENLRTCVFSLRKALGDTERRIIASEGRDIVLNAAAFAVDVVTFRRLAAQPDLAELQEAVKLYEGEFLEGLSIESDEFESWRREEGMRCRDKIFDVLTRLMMRLTELGETEQAIEAGNRILRLEPLHEGAVRNLMQLYCGSGRRGTAILLYRRLNEGLRSELNTQPAPETRALFSELSRAGETHVAAASDQLGSRTRGTKATATRPSGIDVALVPSGTQVDIISLAVLPFSNMSGDPNQEFFSDGITEEITAALAKVKDLSVVARTSAFEFKGQNRDIRTISETLRASHVIEGSMRKAGDRIRITAQLIEARNGIHLWSENYNRDLTDIFAVQEDIAQAIARAVRAPLGLKQDALSICTRAGDRESYEGYLRAPLVRNRMKDIALYEGYLRARSLIRARELTKLAKATALLEEVVASDATFAPAWSMLALAYDLTPNYHPAWIAGDADALGLLVSKTILKAEQAAQKAMQLDAYDEYAYLALAFALSARGKFLEAEANYRQALDLDPNNPDVLHAYSGMLADVGYLREALAMRQQLQELEPFVPVFKWITALVMSLNGQEKEAIALLEALPQDAGRQFYLTMMYAANGTFDKAADAIQQISPMISPSTLADDAGRLFRLLANGTASPGNLPQLGIMGFLYLYLGVPERSLEFYERNFKGGYLANSTGWLWHPSYDEVRKTERFKTFARDAGLTDYWNKRGRPDCFLYDNSTGSYGQKLVAG